MQRRLDRRITIQAKTETGRSGSGQPIIEWTTLATVWAEKVENRGAERFSNPQYVGNAVKTFKIRWSRAVSQITDIHRIMFDGRAFDITDVRELGRREGIEIDCYARGEEPLVPAPSPSASPTFDSTLITFDSTQYTMDAAA